MPTAIPAPPTICSQPRLSFRSGTAKATARKGWKFATRVACDGPTRATDLNHRMLVRKSGPSTAYTSSSHTAQPRWKSWLATWFPPVIASGIQPKASTTALMRKGE
jgi:hypothetical protein